MPKAAKNSKKSSVKAVLGYVPRRLGKMVSLQQNKIPVIYLGGVIAREGGLKAGLHLETVQDAIDKAFKMRKAKAVALLINSPGGSPVQSQLIFNYIRMKANETKKPVIAFVEDCAASGGYWLACSADEIIALETSILGSIGVVTSFFGFHKVIEKIGVERRVYTQGDSKALLDPFQAEKKEDIEMLDEIQKDVYQAFKDMVKSRRKDKLTLEDEKLFSGRVWTGNQSLQYGLCDGLGDVNNVIRERYGKDVKLVSLGKEKGMLKRLFKVSIGGATAENWLDTVIERHIWSRYLR